MKKTIIRQYRKKPVVVEAVQLNTTNMPEVADWIGGDTAKIVVESEEAWKLGKGVPGFSMTIHTLEGDMTAKSGDYIIKGVNGEFYPCKPDIFAQTYEEYRVTMIESVPFSGVLEAIELDSDECVRSDG